MSKVENISLAKAEKLTSENNINYFLQVEYLKLQTEGKIYKNNE